VNSSEQVLKQFWGFDHFRPNQKAIVEDAVAGKDVLALLPTGGGKSICFQVPGLMREGVTVVISPLIALMQDQVDNLSKRGIRAKSITLSLIHI
jgi:ATP-dependent DNA helicase RecQ